MDYHKAVIIWYCGNEHDGKQFFFYLNSTKFSKMYILCMILILINKVNWSVHSSHQTVVFVNNKARSWLLRSLIFRMTGIAFCPCVRKVYCSTHKEPPVRRFYIFLYCYPEKLLNKQSCWWFEMSWRSRDVNCYWRYQTITINTMNNGSV